MRSNAISSNEDRSIRILPDVITYDGDSDFVISNNNNALTGGGYIKPYDNNQECLWKINTVKNAELHMSASIFDIDHYGDSLTTTIGKESRIVRKQDVMQVFVATSHEIATFHGKSDGNYGRAGFVIHPTILDCICGGPDHIKIDDSKQSAFFAPQPNYYQVSSYCANMECSWHISSPPGTIMVIEMDGAMRSSSTKNDTLRVVDYYMSNIPKIIANSETEDLQYIISNNITVHFHGSDARPKNRIKVFDLLSAMSSVSSIHTSFMGCPPSVSTLHKLTEKVLTLPSGFEFVQLDTIPERSTQTFTFNNSNWSTLAAYSVTPLRNVDQVAADDIYILDGETTSYEAIHTVLSLTQCDENSRRKPFLAKTGKITVIRLNRHPLVASFLNQLFIKGHSESEECNPGGDLLLVGDFKFPRYRYISSSNKLAYCPITLVAPPSNLTYFSALLTSYNLAGTDSPVKVLPGTVLSQTIPLYSFDKKTIASWNKTFALGFVLTILVPSGAEYDFTAEALEYTTTDLYLGHDNTIAMSPAYPFGGDFSVPGIFTYTVESSNDLRFELEVVDLKLEGQSELKIYTGNSTLIYTANEKMEASFKLHTEPTISVIFRHYRWDENDAVYLIRYMVRSLQELKADIEAHLTEYPDYPKPGIVFRDVFPLVANSALFSELCLSIADHVRSLGTKVDAVAGLEARGFLFGPTIAHALNIPFVPIRKKGKLPGKVVESSYEKEYGTDTVEMQVGAIKEGANVFIVDDLLATGGTMNAAIKLVEKCGGHVTEAFVVVELTGLKGRAVLSEGANLHSLVHFDF